MQTTALFSNQELHLSVTHILLYFKSLLTIKGDLNISSKLMIIYQLHCQDTQLWSCAVHKEI